MFMIELITKDNYDYVNVLILMLQQIKGIENIRRNHISKSILYNFKLFIIVIVI